MGVGVIRWQQTGASTQSSQSRIDIDRGPVRILPLMRIDLQAGGRRPLHLRVVLRLVRWYLGMDPGPPTAITYRPDLFTPGLRQYLLRSASGDGGWSKGEAEMFSAFVSNLNSCHF